ncbi:MAG: 50S ribosomal protein L18 [Candidatus Zixiibacteriota bacterium]
MADKNIQKAIRAERRHLRVRKRVIGTAERPRLTVYKSLRHTFVQIIDDEKQATLVGLASNSKKISAEIGGGKKADVAKKLGIMAAKLAKEKGIEKVVFDRNQFRYHGRVKAVADGAREGGLQF